MATFDDVRRISLSLPETTEVLTWDTDITFRVGKKIFAIGGDGDGGSHASIKSSLDFQSDLVYPETFAPAPYVGRYVDLERVDVGELEGLLRQAWRMTAPKRLAATLPGSTQP